MYSNKSRSPAPYYPTNLVQAYTHAEQAYISDIFIFSTRVNMKLTIMSRRKSLHDDLPKIYPSDVGFLTIFVVWSFISYFHVLLSFCTPFFPSHFFPSVSSSFALALAVQLTKCFAFFLLFFSFVCYFLRCVRDSAYLMLFYVDHHQSSRSLLFFLLFFFFISSGRPCECRSGRHTMLW